MKLKPIALIALSLVTAGCLASYNSRQGWRYSVVFVSTGKHEVDRVAYDAETRAKAECYVHGSWHASAEVPVWTDETNEPEDADAISFQYPVCSREDEFLMDVSQAIQDAHLHAKDLKDVSIVQVTMDPNCKSESGVFGHYDACTNGFVIEVNRGLARNDRQVALRAAFQALLQARTIRGAWSPWGLGEPTGYYSAASQQQRLDDYTKLPGWADTAGALTR